MTTLTNDPHRVPHYGVFETSFAADAADPQASTAFDVTVVFTRPDGSSVKVDAFHDGGRAFKARAYADALGEWQWATQSSRPGLDGLAGSFTVVPSALKGQLRHHRDDPHQFAYENGEWFLHVGDTGYRFVTDIEPEWRAYIDQAEAAGFTKIRTWFSRGRRDVQARFSAFPNVHWCVSNDQEMVPDGTEITGRMVHEGSIHQIARDMAAREPWGTLLTNHQCRFKGYSFCDAEWSDIVTLEDLDQVSGQLILEYRERVKVPVINDEDRYEHYRPPAHPRYFFRRLMWASLLSGGHTTYCGTVTFEPYDGELRGVQGYFDAARAGKLEGAQDFRNLHVFFNDTGLTLVGFDPDDAYVGSRPEHRKCSRTGDVTIIYLANPDGSSGETDDMAQTVPDVTVTLDGAVDARWFNPRTGLWDGAAELSAGTQTLVAPDVGDWVLLLRRKN